METYWSWSGNIKLSLSIRLIGAFVRHVPCRLLRRYVRDSGGLSYEDRLTTNDSSPSLLASEELTTAANINASKSTSEKLSKCKSLLAQMRRQSHIYTTLTI